MKDDITILKNYYESTKDFETRMAIQILIDVIQEWRKNVRNTKRSK